MTFAASDGDLLARVRAGDDRAFTLLVKKHRHLVRRAVVRVTRGHARTEEVMQDAFLHVFRHVDRFEERCALGSWLFRVATNAALMEHRGARRHADAVQTASVLARDGVDVFGRRPRGVDDLVGDRELARHAARAVDALPEPDRSVFIRTALDQAPLAEVARELALTVSAVKSRLCRTRSALRHALGPDIEGTDRARASIRGHRGSY